MGRKYSSLYERLVANTKVDERGCWVWQGRTRAGYPAIAVRVPGAGRKRSPRTVGAHRLMLEEFHDVTFPHDEAGHLCGNPMCINPEHLEVQTKAANMADRWRKTTDKCMIPVLYPRNPEPPVWDETAITMLPGDACPF